jgi:hypothetical protein
MAALADFRACIAIFGAQRAGRCDFSQGRPQSTIDDRQPASAPKSMKKDIF